MKTQEMTREANDNEPIVKAAFVYRHIGPSMEHNYLCAVCREKTAVIELWHGILQPCWDCQKQGYKLLKLGKFLKWWMNK